MTVSNRVIQKAEDEEGYLTGDAELRRIAELRHRWMLDYNSAVSEAFEEEKETGIAEEIAEGRAEEKKEMIIAMFKNGFKISEIAKVTDLSTYKIRKIKEELK